MNDLLVLQKIRKQAIVGIICWFLCWLIIPAFIWLVFQILMVISCLEYNGKNRTIYLIFSIVGIFAIGGITDIILLVMSSSELEELKTKYPTPSLGI